MNKDLEIRRRHERFKRLKSKELRQISKDERKEVEELVGPTSPYGMSPAETRIDDIRRANRAVLRWTGRLKKAKGKRWPRSANSSSMSMLHGTDSRKAETETAP